MYIIILTMIHIILSKLEAALLYNLTIYDKTPWKNRQDINKTNKEILDSNNGLYFSSDLNNIHNIMKKLIKRGLISRRVLAHRDKRNRDVKKVSWRLKEDEETQRQLNQVIMDFLCNSTKDHEEKMSFLNFYKTYSPWSKKKFVPPFKTDRSPEKIRQLYNQYHIQDIQLQNLKLTLKSVYNVDVDKPLKLDNHKERQRESKTL